jgi:flagellar hook-associated protein 2
MNKINSSDDNDDVTATIINGELGPQLVLGSKTTGLDSTISVTATDSDGNTGLADTFAMTEVTPAKNAIVYIDGVKVVSQKNTIEEGITGVSLTLTAADIDKTTTLTVSKDTAKTKTAIEGFVTAYNSVMTTIKSLSSYDADTEQAGILQGDSLPRSIQSQMRNMLSSQYSTSDGNKMLANLGITTTTAGLLEVDSTKLTAAIASDTGAIAEMFSTEDTGLASRMSSLMDSYVDSGGVLDSRDSSLDDQLSRLTDSREALATRMSAYSDRLYAQYNAMDLIVASLNSTSEDLQSRLDSLPGLVNNN